MLRYFNFKPSFILRWCHLRDLLKISKITKRLLKIQWIQEYKLGGFGVFELSSLQQEKQSKLTVGSVEFVILNKLEYCTFEVIMFKKQQSILSYSNLLEVICLNQFNKDFPTLFLKFLCFSSLNFIWMKCNAAC